MRETNDDMEGKTVWRSDDEIRELVDDVDIPEDAITPPDDEVDEVLDQPVSDEQQPAITAPFESGPDEDEKSVPEQTHEKVPLSAGATVLGQEVTAEDARPELPPGEQKLAEIREEFANRRIRRDFKNSPQEPAYQQLVDEAKAWLTDHKHDDVVDDDVATIFADRWIKRADARKQDPLGDPEGAKETLAAYHADVVRTRTLGFGRLAETIALYNNPDDLAGCFTADPGNRHLTESAVKRVAEKNFRDVPAAVEAYLERVDALTMGYGDKLDDAALQKFAAMQDTAEALDKAHDYIRNVEALTDTYAGHSIVTPTIIKIAARARVDPAKAIEDKLAIVNDLTEQYAGKEGLTPTNIMTVAMDNRNATGRIEKYLTDLPLARAAADNRLPDEVIRATCLSNTSPVDAIKDIAKQADDLRTTHPTATDAEVVYYARKFGGDAATRLQTYLTDVQAAEEHFGGDARVTATAIRRISLTHPPDVVAAIQEKLDVVTELQNEFQADNVPSEFFNNVLASRDPKARVEQFVRNRNALTTRYGDMLPDSVIRDICTGQADPVAYVTKLLDDATDQQEKYRGKGPDVPLANLVRGGIRVASDPESRQEVLDEVYSNQVLRSMRGYFRENPRAQSGITKEVYDERTEELGAAINDAANAKGIPVDEQTAREFRKLWYNYTRTVPALRSDMGIAVRVFNEFQGDVNKLQDAGFTRNVTSIAKFHDPDVLLSTILDSEQPGMARLIATGRPTNPTGAIKDYYNRLDAVSKTFEGRADVNANLIRDATRNYATADAAVAAIKSQMEGIRSLSAHFAGREGVSDEVVRYYSMRVTADPIRSVEQYLGRRETLQDIYGEDGDFDDTVIEELAMRNSPRNATPDQLRERLRTEAEGYRGRYHRLKEAVEAEGMEPEEATIRYIAVSKSDNVERRVERVRTLDAARQKQKLRLDQRLSPSADSGDAFEIIGDQSVVAALNPETMAVEQDEAVERRHQVANLLGNLDTNEALLVAHRFGIDTGDNPIDEDELRKALGVQDLDKAVEAILKKLRNTSQS